MKTHQCSQAKQTINDIFQKGKSSFSQMLSVLCSDCCPMTYMDGWMEGGTDVNPIKNFESLPQFFA